jgi:hypothetical protein
MKKKYINPRMDVITLTTCQSILTGSSLVNTIDGGDTGLTIGTDDEVDVPLSPGLLPEDFLFAE